MKNCSVSKLFLRLCPNDLFSLFFVCKRNIVQNRGFKLRWAQAIDDQQKWELKSRLARFGTGAFLKITKYEWTSLHNLTVIKNLYDKLRLYKTIPMTYLNLINNIILPLSGSTFTNYYQRLSTVWTVDGNAGKQKECEQRLVFSKLWLSFIPIKYTFKLFGLPHIS